MSLTTVACGFEHPYLEPADTDSESSGSTDVDTNESSAGTTVDGSTSTTDEDSTSPPDCGAISFELGVEPPQVVLLLDKSFKPEHRPLTPNHPAHPTGGPTRPVASNHPYPHSPRMGLAARILISPPSINWHVWVHPPHEGNDPHRPTAPASGPNPKVGAP